jgi:hypothetical protein
MKSRRDVLWLAPSLVAVSAGCSLDSVTGEEPNSPDLYICNETDNHVEYDIELEQTTGDNQLIVDERAELGRESDAGRDSECKYYPNVITERGSYTLRVNPSLSYDVVVMFDEPTEPTTQEGDSDGVGITLFDDTYSTDFYSITV